MTPNRGKRNSKVPERFSSEDLRIETSNSNGVTIIDYNDKTTSTTHRLAPINTKIKLKPAIREPLKVKLPKLKRPASSDYNQNKTRVKSKSFTSTKDEESNSEAADNFEFRSQKINKIKLPSLSKGHTSPKNVKSVSANEQKRQIQAKGSSEPEDNAMGYKQPRLDGLTSQKSLEANNVSTLDSFKPLGNDTVDDLLNSSSSSDETNSSGMQIIMGERVSVSTSDENNVGDSGIKCPCGVDADLGLMVECEKCSTWQHGHCINVGREEDSYEGYVCGYCLFPQGRHIESLYQLTVGDKFQQKFDQLASNSSSSEAGEPNRESGVIFSVDELIEATGDLKRVANSLDAKWKLFLNSEYPTELRLWTNAVWSENPDENLKQRQKTTSFIGDIRRTNLELNIRNMIQKMATRLNLIRCQISACVTNAPHLDEVDSKRLTHGLKLLDEVAKSIGHVQAVLARNAS